MPADSPTLVQARADAYKVIAEHQALTLVAVDLAHPEQVQAMRDLIVLGWIAGATFANRQASEFLNDAVPARQAL
jgi:hypothetical protein